MINKLEDESTLLRKILYDTSYRILAGNYYQAAKATWIRQHPESLEIKYSFFDVVWHCVF